MHAGPNDRIVILGAGHAAGRAAEALRGAGFAGPLEIVGDEPWPPYERPPLSKELLTGKAVLEKCFVRPRPWYDEQRIALRLVSRASAIDRATRRVMLADGTEVPYDFLLLAMGARPRLLRVPGGDGPAVHYVRAIADTLALRPKLGEGARIVVLGAGFIGLEVAAAARMRGCAVTVLELAPHALGRVCAPEIGGFFERLHAGHGVDLRLGVAVTEIRADRDRAVVFTGAGEAIEADAVVAGIGAVPNAELAAAAGLAVDDGVVTDAFGRTSDPRIFAAGDVTRHFNPLVGRHVRLESWQNAQNQAIAVAKAMTGADAPPYAELPWFWTDQYDVNFQAFGAALVWDRLVWRGSAESGKFICFYLQEGRPVGANLVGMPREIRFVRDILKRGALVDPAKLGDSGVKLADLTRP